MAAPFPASSSLARCMSWRARVLFVSLLALLFMTGCSLFDGEPPPPGESTPELATPQVPTPTPEPTPNPRELTICVASEPENLFLFARTKLAEAHVLEAIYDGPIDDRDFAYRPVILEDLPHLSTKGAGLFPVQVDEGDWVVNDSGEAVQLYPGEKVRPSGCFSSECAVAWEGGPLEMAQLTATFTLLEGLRWSDGEPLTAGDSVFGFEIAQLCQRGEIGPCSDFGLVAGGEATVERTASYEALDERRVTWMGLPGFMDPEYPTNFFHPLPAHQLRELPPQSLFRARETAIQPMGWGPYVIEEWREGESIRLRRNPLYFRATEGLPRFDLLTFRFVGRDGAANLSALAEGACDVLDQEASQSLLNEDIPSVLEWEARGQIAAHFATGTSWEQLAFGIQRVDYDNGFHPWADRPDFFSDTRTRRAIAYCLDRQRVVDEAFFGKSIVPDSYLPPSHPLHHPGLPVYQFNPQAGMALLDEVGWIDDGDPDTPRIARGVPNVFDGTPLVLSYVTTPGGQRQQTSRILAESLSECGVGVEIDYIPAETLFAEGPDGPVFGRRYDLAQLAWFTGIRPPCDLYTTGQVPGPPDGVWFPVGSLEAKQFLLGWGGLNSTGFSHPEYDRACQASLETLPGQPGYVENHHEAQEIFTAELPAVPLAMRLRLALTRPEITGFLLDTSALSEMWNIEAIDRVD